MRKPSVLYLHGFCSSPASWKARLLGEHLAARGLADRFLCPTLPPVPRQAVARVEEVLAVGDRSLTLVGSSLGGFYASWLAEKYDLPAVLINPAVMAAALLAGMLGRHRNFHTGESFDFTPEHVAELRGFSPQRLTPGRYLLLVETGDEVLDYRQAVEHYAGCRQIVLAGGDHSFTRFAELLPQIVEYCGL